MNARLDWQRRALCTHPSVRPEDFSPIKNYKTGEIDMERAADIAHRACRPCPVRAQCAAYAIELAANGTPPREMVVAGIWWPGQKDAQNPINLIADQRRETAA